MGHGDAGHSRWSETAQANAEREAEERRSSWLCQCNADSSWPVPGPECIEQLFKGQGSLNGLHVAFDRFSNWFIFARNLAEKSHISRLERLEGPFIQAMGCRGVVFAIEIQGQRIDSHLPACIK
jgi:hypothetical protein